jgi:Zn-dependent protease
VLYALRYPFSFGVLIVTFVVGVTVRGLVQQLVSGERRPKWVRANTKRRRSTWLRPYFDVYGAIAALLGGVGWGAPVDTSDPRHRSKGRRVAQLLLGPLVLAALGTGLLLAFRAWTHLNGLNYGPHAGSGEQYIRAQASLYAVSTGQSFAGSARLVSTGQVFIGSVPGHLRSHFEYGPPFGQVALLLAGVELLAMGVLAILPIPPLDGGRLLFALTPRSGAWQRVRFRLDEENWGLLILLFCSFPVIFRRVLLISILGAIVNPLVRLIA